MGNKESKRRKNKPNNKTAPTKNAECEREPSYCRRWGKRGQGRCENDASINYDLLQQCGVQQSLCHPSQMPTLGPTQQMPPTCPIVYINPQPCLCGQNNQRMPGPILCNCPRPPMQGNFNQAPQCQPHQQIEMQQPRTMACCCCMPVNQTSPAPMPSQSYAAQPSRCLCSQQRQDPNREIHFAPKGNSLMRHRNSQNSITLNIDFVPCPQYSDSYGPSSNMDSSHYPRQWASDTSSQDYDSPSSCCSSCCSSYNSSRSVVFPKSKPPKRSCLSCFKKNKSRSPKYNPRKK